MHNILGQGGMLFVAFSSKACNQKDGNASGYQAIFARKLLGVL